MLEEVKEFSYDETKLFECECQVMDLNENHPLLDLTEVAVEDVTIAIEGFEGKPIGTVSFHTTGEAVIADIQLEYSCPERLDVEANKVYLDVEWFIGHESLGIYDICIVVGFLEPYQAKLTLKQPHPTSTPITLK